MQHRVLADDEVRRDLRRWVPEYQTTMPPVLTSVQSVRISRVFLLSPVRRNHSPVGPPLNQTDWLEQPKHSGLAPKLVRSTGRSGGREFFVNHQIRASWFCSSAIDLGA